MIGISTIQFALRLFLAIGMGANEALEQIVVRLSIEDEVSNLSWSIIPSSIE